MEYKLIGKKIKKARKDKGLTQENLAEMLDVSVSFICQVENGDKKFNLSRISEVSQVLERPIDYFIDGYVETSGEESELDKIIKGMSKNQLDLLIEIAKIIDEVYVDK